jgi:superoxide dismutase
MKHQNIIKIIAFILLAAPLSVMAQKAPFVQAPLPYAYNALEPVIDAQTMEIHYAKHHAAYVKNLNAAVKGTEFEQYTRDELMLYTSETSDATRNNVGGDFNHELFWNILAVNHPFNPQSEVGKAIISAFGSVDSLKTALKKAGSTRFGSGWAWLYLNTDLKLAVSSSPNQDNPIMDISAERGVPIIGIDVWEHAYYLKYQNKRGDYLTAIMTIINWDNVNKNYIEAMNGEVLKTISRETWKGLVEFHGVMSQTFHPSEDGDLEPIKKRAGEMVAKAKMLQSGKIPPLFDNAAFKKAISDLVTGSEELNKLVNNKADDKVITEKLGKLHDTFHLIQGMCRH